MKRLNILLVVAAISLGFNGYSQTVQDVLDRKQQISQAFFNEEVAFLEVDLYNPNFPFKIAQVLKLDAEIIQIATYADERFGENHTAFVSYTFNYQGGELVNVSITQIDEIDVKPSTEIATKEFYFHKGKAFAATMGEGNIDSYNEKELESSDFSEQVERLKLFEKSDFLLDKSWEAFNHQ